MTFRFTTAGESHGRGLVGILEGIPAGVVVPTERINAELKRRMGGYGRGARMKIEADQIEWLAGVRAGETLGSPIAMLVWNRDWEHWQDIMAPEADTPDGEGGQGGQGGRRRQVTRPRPGHADLAGSLKYDRQDARDILERASARETVAGRARARPSRGSRAAPSASCCSSSSASRSGVTWSNWEVSPPGTAPRSPLP